MRFTVVLSACLFVGMTLGSLASCGGNAGGPGTGGTGGTSDTGGRSGTGGAAGGGAGAGGTATSGGAGGRGGSAGGAGGSPVSVLPSGRVTQCYGDGCPMGWCDDDLFFANVACSGVYTSPVNATSTYCNSGQTSAYCLFVDNGSLGHWGITCTDGTAFGKRCTGGCNSGPGYITCY